MRPLLETIFTSTQQTSFKYFIRTAQQLESYWHYHPEIEITYFKSGTGLRFVGDSIKPFQAGDLVMTGENLPHDYISNEGDESIEAHVFQFSKTLFQQFPECIALYPLFSTAAFGLKFDNYPVSIIEKIEHFHTQTPIQQFIHLLEILNLLSEISTTEKLSSISFTSKTKNTQHQNKISIITKYITTHLDRPIALDEIAQFANMSPPSFCRWFKAAVGNSFVTYLNTARIERACQQLLQTEDSIGQIAFNNGFETIGHFNRVFKKLKTVPPSQYRKQIQLQRLNS